MATGDAPLPKSEDKSGAEDLLRRNRGRRPGQRHRIDAINASYVENPDTSIEDALVTVVKEREALDGSRLSDPR